MQPALESISPHDPDLIFADILLGELSGIDLLRVIKDRGLHCPVIMITGKPNVATAAEAVRLGAFDYLPKPVNKESVLKAPHGIALAHKALLDENDRSEKEKVRYRKHLQAVFRSVRDAIITVDTDMRIVDANDAVGSVCGMPAANLVGRLFPEIPLECLQSCVDLLKGALKTRRATRGHRIECRSSGGSKQVIEVNLSPLLDENARFRGAVLLLHDMTRLDILERELEVRSRFSRHHRPKPGNAAHLPAPGRSGQDRYDGSDHR